MPNLTASIPHQLGREEAKRRIQEQIGAMRTQHGAMFSKLQETWNGDAMEFAATTMGQSVSGRLVVEESVLHVTVALPWMLSIMAGSIKHKLEEQGRQLLALPAK
jgi:hypothetical protein